MITYPSETPFLKVVLRKCVVLEFSWKVDEEYIIIYDDSDD